MKKDIREYYELLSQKGFSKEQINFLNDFYEIGDFQSEWLESFNFLELRKRGIEIGNIAGNLGGWIDNNFYNDMYEFYHGKVLFGDCDYFKVSEKIDKLFLTLNERVFRVIENCEECEECEEVESE